MNEEDEGKDGAQYNPPDLFEARVTGDRATIDKLMKEPGIDLGCRPHPEVNLDGTGTLLVYASEERIAKLEAEGYKLERGENVSELGRQRLKEVGEGDRFEGGRVTPRGLGDKTDRGRKGGLS
jgi:hypothetical protein